MDYNSYKKIQEDILFVKSIFSDYLEDSLNLIEVECPILTQVGDGVQDNLSGTERAVSVSVKAIPDKKFEVVQSLAKWKRLTLGKYNFPQGQGIYTNMKAIRQDEDELNTTHSVYVDQWDWELVIKPEDRNLDTLKDIVRKLWKCIKDTEKEVCIECGLTPFLPDNIHFIHSEDLFEKYPHLNAKNRERKIAKKYGAVFLIGIGYNLSANSGYGGPHDLRAPDYDDWSTVVVENDKGYYGLNGDILVWNPFIKGNPFTDIGEVFEISSMGIRVNAEALNRQLGICHNEDRKEFDWHKKLLAGEMPQTIGGGIGQSRLVMLLLQLQHIGQVQCGVWPESVKNNYEGIL